MTNNPSGVPWKLKQVLSQGSLRNTLTPKLQDKYNKTQKQHSKIVPNL